MGTITKDPNVLMSRWMKVYLNLCILRSSDPEVQNCLDIMKLKLAVCNKGVMKIFDMVDATPEDEGP